MIEILLPPNYSENHDKCKIFLAGPIQGAPNWQQEAINLISKKTSGIDYDLMVCSPRTKEWHKGYDFEKQIDWETYYLTRANITMFWLCNETEHFCNRAYAQTTRFELAEHLMRSRYANGFQKWIIGFDTNFSGTKYIKHRIKKDYHWIPIFDSFEETVDKVVETYKSYLEDAKSWDYDR